MFCVYISYCYHFFGCSGMPAHNSYVCNKSCKDWRALCVPSTQPHACLGAGHQVRALGCRMQVQQVAGRRDGWLCEAGEHRRGPGCGRHCRADWHPSAVLGAAKAASQRVCTTHHLPAHSPRPTPPAIMLGEPCMFEKVFCQMPGMSVHLVFCLDCNAMGAARDVSM